MAASAHFFGWAGLQLPAALNGPQYIAERGTGDAAFRARRDVMPVPSAPGLGIAIGETIRRRMQPVARLKDTLPA
jgi:L-alanine-DL-glutamate epimerase-like enolase superfamily enzyme